MDLSKFTQKSQEGLSEAQNIAIRHSHQQVDVEHLGLALIEQEGLVARILERAGLDSQAYKKALEEELKKFPRVSGPGAQSGQIYVTQRLNSLLVKAQDLAKQMQDEYTSVEHIFLAMLDEPSSTGMGRVNSQFRLHKDRVLTLLSEVRGNQRVTSANPEATKLCRSMAGI